MSIRKFLFCDFCNPEGIRIMDDRRRRPRENNSGRRNSDSRVWFEGTLKEAVSKHGWVVNKNGKHICPDCKRRIAGRSGMRLADIGRR